MQEHGSRRSAAAAHSTWRTGPLVGLLRVLRPLWGRSFDHRNSSGRGEGSKRSYSRKEGRGVNTKALDRVDKPREDGERRPLQRAGQYAQVNGRWQGGEKK